MGPAGAQAGVPSSRSSSRACVRPKTARTTGARQLCRRRQLCQPRHRLRADRRGPAARRAGTSSPRGSRPSTRTLSGRWRRGPGPTADSAAADRRRGRIDGGVERVGPRSDRSDAGDVPALAVNPKSVIGAVNDASEQLRAMDEVVSAFDDKGLVAADRNKEKSDDFWTMNHMKLLYLISKYSHCAQTVHEKERWIRKLPMLVLIYEGIVQKVFEYDYAPASEVVETTRVYLNVSQEGKDDLDDLVEGKLVKGLRLSTKEHQSVTAYQILAQRVGADIQATPRRGEAAGGRLVHRRREAPAGGVGG